MRHSTWQFSVQILAVLIVAATLSGGPRQAAADPAVYEIGDDPGVGFNLISWFNFDNAATPLIDEGTDEWEGAVQALFNAGFREVSISPVRFFNTTTFAIAPTSTQGPNLPAIEAGVVRAQQLGMRVTLNPFVEPQGFNGWRGTYNPQGAAADTFWADYQNYLVAVAQIAQTHDVEAMTVGTEYNAIDQDPANNGRWNTVINAIDGVYHGQLGYASNWDHYNIDNVRDAIWEHPAIDFIGIDSYFSNTLSNYYRFLNPGATNQQVTDGVNAWVDASGSYPNQSFIDLMTAAWNYRLDSEILPFAAARKAGQGMPVEFTEVGYQHHNRTARSPQTESGAVDTAEQRMAFQGLLNALDGRANVFEAMHIWQWWMPGSDGSTWNIDPTLPVNQPDNRDLALFLQAFAATAVTPLEGDYNRDGTVDAADYTAWRDSLGQFAANYNAADGNGNGVIDDGDYDVWKANFAAAPGSGGVAAPEPASVGLLLIALGGTSLSRRRSAWCV